MKIHLYGTIDGERQHIMLPKPTDWGVAVPRMKAVMTGLLGNSIVQTQQKSNAAGSAVFSGEIPVSDAEAVRELDEAASSCFLCDGERLYEAVFDASPIQPSKIPGKRKMTIKFDIIRRIL